jgi:hypothetical protein
MQIRHEIYDENGLVRVENIEVQQDTVEQMITDREQELIKIYEEIQKLKNEIK